MSPANKTLFILGLSSGSAGLLAQPLVKIEFMPRTLNQMSAFCEARGFQPATVELLSKQCFITIRIYNTGRQSIWLDLDNWRFSTNSKTTWSLSISSPTCSRLSQGSRSWNNMK